MADVERELQSSAVLATFYRPAGHQIAKDRLDILRRHVEIVEHRGIQVASAAYAIAHGEMLPEDGAKPLHLDELDSVATDYILQSIAWIATEDRAGSLGDALGKGASHFRGCDPG